ncbi:MAG: outer membrane protein OmpA-like peptidoglycan-associated protein [Cyclobacteriaceae bacterium]|jgi:outer membrane protein OmpA-like peptidoglycan-associated protein
MKKIYTFLLIVAVSTSIATAQNSKTKKADQLYDRMAYTDAAEAYQKALKKGEGSRYVFERLANSYFFINDTKKAEPFYKRVVKGKKVNSETVYNYAQSLKANGKISDYNTWMKKFSEMKPLDSRAVEFMKNPDYVPQIMDAIAMYEAKNLSDINSEYSEFGGFVIGKDFYFTSARNTSRKKYKWDDQPFLDVYKASLVGNTIKNAELLEGDVNTKYHEGNVAITADGKRMYFDRNDYFEGKYAKNEEGVNQINIYYSEKIDGNWKGIFSVPFNSTEYSIGHPALSPDGNTLYFVSDKPGGKGDSDIYKVSIDSKDTFGSPERLGDNINTEGKEVFPYIDSNGALYFSSNGHQGLGGLDGFYAEANRGNGFNDPVNLGKGANSSDDDFAFIYDPNTKSGFMSSNRKGGNGSDDIYAITAIEIPCTITIDATIVDEYSKAPVSGARVDLYDTDDTKLSTKTSDVNGKVSFKAACDTKHVLQAVATDYESNATTVDAANDTTVMAALNLRPIEAIIQGEKIVLNPIYFDYDRSNVKPKGAFELDKLVAIMKKYPSFIIKVESHTDSKGKDDYNLSLSEKRAQASVQYVISKGVSATRITGEGFGESKPINACKNSCTDAERQMNRRSEFVIVER